MIVAVTIAWMLIELYLIADHFLALTKPSSKGMKIYHFVFGSIWTGFFLQSCYTLGGLIG